MDTDEKVTGRFGPAGRRLDHTEGLRDYNRHFTLKTLKLDMEAGARGETWDILPKDWPGRDPGKNYPLPSRLQELERVAILGLVHGAKDSGSVYIRRAREKLTKLRSRTMSATLDVAHRREKIVRKYEDFRNFAAEARRECRAETEKVREEASRAIASLNDLFALGREGLEKQMRAHLENTLHQDEKISAAAFRDCFRMVTQAVKGLGLPSDQRQPAHEAVIEELAASLRATQGALAMEPGTGDETPQ